MAKNGVLLQYFEWYLEPGFLWRQLSEQAEKLADMGITSVWIPPAYKGMGGQDDVGYSSYDLYDLGEFDQKGSIPTKYGTKDELIMAIKALHKVGVDVYADIVLDHKMGADEVEYVKAKAIDVDDRTITIDENEEDIGAFTRFTFPGRGGKYSAFQWSWHHFDAVDWDEKNHRDGLFLLKGKRWDNQVDGEKGNYDYLMGADIDLSNKEVIQELKQWGEWFLKTTNVDGFRFDAVKHMRFAFYRHWLRKLRKEVKEELFSVGEYWNSDVHALLHYLDATSYEFSLFDVPLHYRFYQAATSNGAFDLRTIFDDTLTRFRPDKSVTFVDNHDTQPSQALESYIPDWFKPIAYSLILLRQEGYPCVFYGDLYGIPYSNIPSGKRWLAPLLTARKNYAYGQQNDYFNDPNLIGWTREGDSEYQGSGLAVLISGGDENNLSMYVGTHHADKQFYDCMGGFSEPITITSDGNGSFSVHGGSVSVWVPVG